jgi:hypothetical protein
MKPALPGFVGASAMTVWLYMMYLQQYLAKLLSVDIEARSERRRSRNFRQKHAREGKNGQTPGSK